MILSAIGLPFIKRRQTTDEPSLSTATRKEKRQITSQLHLSNYIHFYHSLHNNLFHLQNILTSPATIPALVSQDTVRQESHGPTHHDRVYIPRLGKRRALAVAQRYSKMFWDVCGMYLLDVFGCFTSSWYPFGMFWDIFIGPFWNVFMYLFGDVFVGDHHPKASQGSACFCYNCRHKNLEYRNTPKTSFPGPNQSKWHKY